MSPTGRVGWGLLAVLSALVAGLPGAPLARAQESPPNVLLIVTDDQRTSTWNVMRKTTATLRARGTTFTRAHATTPLCCPSRASIMTGRYAHNHLVRTNLDAEALVHDRTIQAYLKGAGYRTAMFGKFLNYWPVTRNPPHFDVWAVIRQGSNLYYDAKWNVGGTIKTISRYATDYISDRAVGFLRASEGNDRRPWFLFLSTTAPHAPYVPEPVYADARVPGWQIPPSAREADRRDKPPYVRQRSAPLSKARSVRAAQLRTLLSVDDMVGQVMARLAELGEQDTLVVFLSDNGFMWADHGLMGKQAPYLPSVRVPFAARWPGHIPAGALDRRIVANVDVAPTVLAAAGVEPTNPMDGRSFLSGPGRQRLLLEFWSRPGGAVPTWASILTTEEQYVEYYRLNGRTVTFREYYDLIADPYQLKNVLGDGTPQNDPDVSALAAQLRAARTCAGSRCP